MTSQKVPMILNRAERRRLLKRPKPQAFFYFREGRSPSINDVMNRRTRRTLPGGAYETYNSYDATGNPGSKTAFNGQNIGYGYHPTTDRLTSVSGPSRAVTYAYDDLGRRWLSGANGWQETFTYDGRDRLKTKTSDLGTLTYGYDGVGNLTSVSCNQVGGPSVSYHYDRANRLDYLVDGHLGTTDYTFDDSNNLDTCTYPNGVKHDWDYDSRSRATSITVRDVTSTVLKRYQYTLTGAGNKTGVTENNGRAVTWTYDGLMRLTGETITNAPVTGSLGYVYDAVGNRLQRTSDIIAVPTQDFLASDYDARDRLTAGRAYDENGSTLGADGWTYAYDAENRLISASKTEASITTNLTYAYDGDGNRVMKIANVTGQTPVTTKYLVDTNNLTGYAQVLEELDGNNIVKKRYTYGLDLISQTDVATSITHYYGYDGTGSVRFLTDSTGAVSDTYDYEAFGQTLSFTGSTNNEFRFHGERQDPETGLTYLRARYLDGNIGRFTVMDDFEGSQNDPQSLHKYYFSNSDPVNHNDPSGRESINIVQPRYHFILKPLLRVRTLYNFASDKLERFLMGWERLANNLYDDEGKGKGNSTIGYGHLVHIGPTNGKEPADLKDGITDDEALDMLRWDVVQAENDVKRVINVPLYQNEYDALVSLSFNMGGPHFWAAAFVTEINRKNYTTASQKFGLYVNNNRGEELPALVDRRKDERNMFDNSFYNMRKIRRIKKQ